MGEEFCWEELSPSLFICVSSAHKFGTDAFLLSDLPLPGGKIFAVIWEPAAVSFRCCGSETIRPACATGRISKSRQLSNWNNPFKKTG